LVDSTSFTGTPDCLMSILVSSLLCLMLIVTVEVTPAGQDFSLHCFTIFVNGVTSINLPVILPPSSSNDPPSMAYSVILASELVKIWIMSFLVRALNSSCPVHFISSLMLISASSSLVPPPPAMSKFFILSSFFF